MPRARVRRRLHQVILVLFCAGILGCTALVGAAWLNDRRINQDRGRALAEVTAVSLTRTTVEFQDEQGVFYSPPTGLLYPTDLGVGQRVWVNYQRSHPELVKVEGRQWTLSIIPATSSALVITAIAALLWWVSDRLTRPPEETAVNSSDQT
nr:DUF3592 domain-containing protein [Corynebacterium poyangense]